MKNVLLFSLIISIAQAFAAKTDSSHIKHSISVSMTNGMSQYFFDGQFGPTLEYRQFIAPAGIPSEAIYFKYLPNYSFHLNLKYFVTLSRHAEIETGIGYLLLSQTVYTQIVDFNNQKSNGTIVYHEGLTTVPIHARFIAAAGTKGAITFTFGPSFSIPIHYFEKGAHYTLNGHPQPDFSEHDKFPTSVSKRLSSMGVDLKIGYKSLLSKRLAIDVGPVINFTDIVLLDKSVKDSYTETSYRPYWYYVGLDVAVNFGLGK